MLDLAFFSQNSCVSERHHGKFHSHLQRESAGKIHVILSLIIPDNFSFAMCSVACSTVVYDASSGFRSVILLMFFNRVTA